MRSLESLHEKRSKLLTEINFLLNILRAHNNIDKHSDLLNFNLKTNSLICHKKLETWVLFVIEKVKQWLKIVKHWSVLEKSFFYNQISIVVMQFHWSLNNLEIDLKKDYDFRLILIKFIHKYDKKSPKTSQNLTIQKHSTFSSLNLQLQMSIFQQKLATAPWNCINNSSIKF